MIKQGDVIPYIDMCKEEGVNLQRGMNFRLKGGFTVILMSIRLGAPYADRIEEEGKILIYEGHDIPSRKGGPNPKMVDQPKKNPSGSLTQNGLFYQAAKKYKINKKNVEPEFIKVYEKIRSGIWVYNGIFKLELLDDEINTINGEQYDIEHNRIIPTSVKLEVWKRDKGRCIKCGSQDNLHFDHIIPYSKGGSSLVAENIQILCARHNLKKKDKIE